MMSFSSFSTSFAGLRAIVATVAIGAVVAAAPAFAAPKVGEAAPDFTGITSKGETVKLSDFKGKTVVLEWTNDGCPYVKKHYNSGNMQNLQKETTSDGVVWLTVISSAPGTQGHLEGPAADELNTSRGAAPTSIVLDADGKIGRLYDAKVTPHMYVINGEGVLTYMGAIDDKPTTDNADVESARNYILNALGQMAKGEKVDPSATRAYGCSVKYSS